MNDLNKHIEMQLEAIGKLFTEKQEQYATEDPLANFRTGAKLRYGNDDYNAMLDALKDYMGKHIAFIYNSDIDAPKLNESLLDVAIYCLIARYMINKEAERHG